MPDYTSNFAALLTGHLGLPGDPPAGGGGSAASKGYNPQGRTDLTDTLDIRDALAHAVAGGYTNFSDDDIKANYNNIARLVGAPKAQKLYLQAFQYNMRSDVKGKSNEEKLRNFYDIGSSDPETKKILNTIKTSSSDPVEGYRTSVNAGVRLLSGEDKKSDNAMGASKLDQLKNQVTIQTGK